MKLTFYIFFFSLALLSCSKSQEIVVAEGQEETETTNKPNILLVIADDMG